MEKSPVIAALQREQASALVLYLNYKKYHWLTFGPHFRDLHLLFEEHGDQVLESVDDLAERGEELYAAEEINLSRRLKRRGRFVILHRHPLLTSGRKAELYTWREHLAFMWRMLIAGRRTLRSREACSVWYDGRR